MLRSIAALSLLLAQAHAACPCTGNGGVSDGSTYPVSIGNTCDAWDNMGSYCTDASSASYGSDWCTDDWCYVDPDNCDEPVYKSSYFPGVTLYFSYKSCDPTFAGNTWVGFCECTGNEGASDGSTYPLNIGRSCAAWDHMGSYCQTGGSSFGSDWCDDPWCYVDPAKCVGYATHASSYFTGVDLHFSYSRCDAAFGGNSWVGMPPTAPPPPPLPPPSAPPSTPPPPRHTPCFGRETSVILASGEAVPMASLKAGDEVVDGAHSTSRVVLTQHRRAEATSALLTLTHAGGSLALTPDHVLLLLDGRYAPARTAVVRSKLTLAEGREAEVTSIVAGAGPVVNAVTVSGKIVAEGVLASAHPEWIAAWMLTSLVPLPLSLCNSISYLLPEATQAYYDALEPLVGAATPSFLAIKEGSSPLSVLLAFALGDLALALGFATYTLASSPTAAIAAAALPLAAYAARPRKA